ncbi:DUF2294 domain-containing protein [Acaryochloris sp. CCMEE 5410]|uniref:DUF2294 domain-containing protein n=1 Tax=Acaryochloris sp. CCMEE 5410 TaxID=310037 RepID=UPI0002484CBA|nr:Na-translocating system protein MpsC family protein [Acaryochloris sp. CCMEE 5410]KAI9132319.1 DUF2294 domain-containing protein [Acaryochloris sp. CCMEE 5410]
MAKPASPLIEETRQSNNSADSHLLTCGEQERAIVQGIQSFWFRHLSHRPQRITCQLFSNSVAIVIEDSVTLPEQFLVTRDKAATAQMARQAIHKFLRPQLSVLLEKILGTKVLVLFCDTTLAEKCTGVVAVLAQSPAVRNPESIPKSTSKRKPILGD